MTSTEDTDDRQWSFAVVEPEPKRTVSSAVRRTQSKRMWSQLSVYLTGLVTIVFIGGGTALALVGVNLTTYGVFNDGPMTPDEFYNKTMSGQFNLATDTHTAMTYPWMLWLGIGVAVVGVLIVIGIVLSRPLRKDVTA